MGELEGNVKIAAEFNDAGFGHFDQRRPNMDARGAFNAGPGGEIAEGFEGVDELRAAIGVTGIVESVDADEDVLGAQDFSPGESEREKNRVAGGHVSDGNAFAHGCLIAIFGHGNVVSEGGVAEDAEIDFGHTMIGGSEGFGNAGGGGDFDGVALAVIERKRETVEAFTAREGEANGGVEPTAQQTDGPGFG